MTKTMKELKSYPIDDVIEAYNKHADDFIFRQDNDDDNLEYFVYVDLVRESVSVPRFVSEILEVIEMSAEIDDILEELRWVFCRK